MKAHMKILIYGLEHECNEAIELFHTLYPTTDVNEYLTVHAWEDIQRQLPLQKPNLVIILADGVAGMEGVYAAREYDEDLAIFWFSNDHEFGMQSHRLECAYFAMKPLTYEKLHRAFRRCTTVGVRF